LLLEACSSGLKLQFETVAGDGHEVLKICD